MGFNYTAPATTLAHEHTALASDGGVLSLTATRVNAFSPLTMVVALG